MVDSRGSDNAVRRRRQCIRCKARFTTYEVHDELYDVLRGHERITTKLNEARVALAVVIDIIQNDLPQELQQEIIA